MLIDKYARPELCAAKEESRYGVNHVWLDAESSHAVATDGCMAVAIPVEVMGDDTGSIPLDALRAARKAAKGPGRDKADLRCNGTVEAYGYPGGATCVMVGAWPRIGPDELRFPAWQEVMPKRGTARLCLNAKLLHALAQAMGAESVEISFELDDKGQPDDNAPLLILPAGERKTTVDGMRGCLMPISRL